QSCSLHSNRRLPESCRILQQKNARFVLLTAVPLASLIDLSGGEFLRRTGRRPYLPHSRSMHSKTPPSEPLGKVEPRFERRLLRNTTRPLVYPLHVRATLAHSARFRHHAVGVLRAS